VGGVWGIIVSVDFIAAATTTFEASHTDETEPACARLHGHTWTVTASVRCVNVAGKAKGAQGLRGHLVSIAAELNGRDVGAMLPGSDQSLQEVATWFLERLSAQHDRVFEVTVDVAGIAITARRELR